ncbi:sterol desaturase family protein [Benzoatithermus flavus]|uniref:Sterol desaturase family protein n=1 Tax=Benzoatithermus flavus TaxID=3108223 RepID=A0ABU8XZN6_9PROT
MLASIRSWSGREYRLDRMTLRELVIAYFTHYSIMVYLALAVIAIVLAVRVAPNWWQPLLGVGLVFLVYPFAEYALHRWVLHARFLYKNPLTAKVWKRIHYDHHQNPHDLSVLFGALYTTLPPIFLLSLPLGWLVGGASAAFAALATALLAFAGYEFCHCVQHLPFTPQNRWLREIKRRHLAHHFHSEQGNYGITTNLWDRILGTLYDRQRDVPRSPTTHNLGYTPEERARYPWVGELSASDEEYAFKRTRRMS